MGRVRPPGGGTKLLLGSIIVLLCATTTLAQSPFAYLANVVPANPALSMQSRARSTVRVGDRQILRDHMQYHYTHRNSARVVQGTTPPEFLQEMDRVSAISASRAAVAQHAALRARSQARDTPTTSTTDLNLGNTGLKDDGSPVRGKMIGPFQSVRSTTIPWNMRHLLGQQVNGAPEPLVYSPIYTFQVTEKLRATKPMEMFDNPNLYKMEFNTPNSNMVVQGETGQASGESSIVDPKAFEIVAPQPPPFVPPKPPGQGAAMIEQSEAAAAQPAPQDPAP